jgi:DNA-binding response OmpR family regulator
VLHILHIEDNGSDSLLLREAVRQSSVEADVTIAADGVDALRVLNSPQCRTDLIVLDINIPKLSGLDVLERYRRENDVVPVIVFTSSQNPKERARASELGVKEYLTKPMDLDEYLNTIRTAIERWGRNRGERGLGWCSIAIPPQPVRILLVDDNPADVLIFRIALGEYSKLTQIRVAADGEQAIQILTESDFKADLIITDVNLPKLSGFSLLEQIRGTVRAVVFSSSSNPQDRKRALELGAREFIQKPMDFEEYQRTVSYIVQTWGLRELANRS